MEQPGANDYMDKEEFMLKFYAARSEWDAMLGEVGTARMLEPGVTDEGWTVKDVIAHNTWNEREMVTMLGRHSMETSGAGLWLLSNDERNKVIYEMYRDAPLSQVLAEARQVYDDLVRVLDKTSEDDLNDASHFEGMPADWVPWKIVAGCTFRHYPDHISDVNRWLATREGKQ
jgi:mycothiol maleylpyruvate isomerase-like protein